MKTTHETLVSEAQPNIENTRSDILTVSEVAEIIRCKPSSVYNLTRTRGLARYKHPIPHIKLPCGLRFRKSSVLTWLAAQETSGVQ
jgi:predicted DNA-binding transcriptional regulator AlpA